MSNSKTQSELNAMREGGKILATIFNDLRQKVGVGVNELDLDAWVAREIVAHGAEATYRTREVGFPATMCISTNEKVQHSIPSNYILHQGDVVNFDLVITYRGMKTDAGFTIIVDETPSGDKKRLLEYTERALLAGIQTINGPTNTLDISTAIEKVLQEGNLGIVKELVGHGIGHKMHERPDIPNYSAGSRGYLLEVGDTIAIEPITTLGKPAIYQDNDGWTLRTVDGSLSAQFEHTVLVTEDGFEILTTL